MEFILYYLIVNKNWVIPIRRLCNPAFEISYFGYCNNRNPVIALDSTWTIRFNLKIRFIYAFLSIGSTRKKKNISPEEICPLFYGQYCP